MAIGSNVNPNYPIPGIDQSSKGFRDNFSAIKVEIEDLQAKNIVLIGDATGNAIIDGGTGDVVINTVVSVANIAAGGTDRTIQFNNLGTLDGNSRLIWDPALTLTVGPQSPDTYYWADLGATKIHDELLIMADSGSSTLTLSTVSSYDPIIVLQSTNSLGAGMALLNISNVDTVTDVPLYVQFNGTTALVANSNGLAIGPTMPSGSPTTTFEAYTATQPTMGYFYTTNDFADNGIRIETIGANSTAGVALQQTNADTVVGMRIGQTGNLTLHTRNLNNGAWLDDSSISMLIDTSGRVGIGIIQPECRLDVDGGLQWNLPNSANPNPVAVDIIGTVVDSWDMSVYRSADYTLQVTDATGVVEITKLLVMHESGVGYQYIYANLNNTGGSAGPTLLGTFTAGPNGSQMELVYSGVAMGNYVKVDATYITL